jgi:hypothetical protein
VLIGGKNYDTYQLGGSFNDQIYDQDGVGNLLDGADAIVGTMKKVPNSSNVWQDDAGKYRFTLAPQGNGKYDLLIKKLSVTTPGLGTIVIRDFKSGDLGITLGDAHLPTTAHVNVIQGDFIKKLNEDGKTYETNSFGYVPDGSAPNAADVLSGSSAADLISSGGGNDGLHRPRTRHEGARASWCRALQRPARWLHVPQ